MYFMQRSLLSKICYELFVRSSWVVFFILICIMVYEKHHATYQKQLKQLQGQLFFFENKKKNITTLNENLKRQIKSQNSPNWIELTLKKKLGLVPEGHIKVIFTKSNHE